MLRSLPRRHVTRPLRLGPRALRAYSKKPTKQRSVQPLQPYEEPGRDSGSNGQPKRTFAPYILGGLGVAMGLYVSQLAVAVSQPCTNPLVSHLDHQKDVAERYDETADTFDSEVGVSEFFMGINGTRDRLAKMCKGHVLEVSCGTGRNLGYYDLTPSSAVDSLTFLDLSKPMVDVCKKKWSALHGGMKLDANITKPGLQVRFCTGSALKAMPLAPGQKKYDTIIQTMGLCSTPEPRELLQNMALHLNTANPNARILLLEHGRSYRGWLNHILDGAAEKHAEIHGCWFNREIGELVQQAAEISGLEVVRERRRHFGTTWIMELKPKAGLRAPTTQEKVAEDAHPVAEQEKATGWRSLLPWK